MGPSTEPSIPFVNRGATNDEARRVMDRAETPWALVVEDGVLVGMTTQTRVYLGGPDDTVETDDNDAGPTLVWLNPAPVSSARRAA